MEEKFAYIKQEMAHLDITLTDQMAEQLYRYYELLVDWNY